MEIEIESIKHFLSSLEEVEVLIASAEANITNEKKYAAYNKSAILLLTGKFENFAESLAEEYIFFINSFKLSAHEIPQSLRLQHTYRVLRKLDSQKQYNNVKGMMDSFSEISSLWNSEQKFNTLSIECKFSYGKHGEKELEKLFASIGIEKLFEEVKVYETQETLLEDNENVEIDIKGIFNSVTNIRNNILHQDDTPNLTIDSIKRYRSILQDFAQTLASTLTNKLFSIKNVQSISSSS